MRNLKLSLIAALSLLLMSCGGGSSSNNGNNSSDNLSLQDVAGIWDIYETENSTESKVSMMLITSTGKVVVVDDYDVVAGSASVNNGQLTLVMTYGYEIETTQHTAHKTRLVLTESLVAKRDVNLVNLYKQGASIAALVGTYSGDPAYDMTPGTGEIFSDGNFRFEAIGSSCVVTAKLSAINRKFNEYSVNMDSSECGMGANMKGYAFPYLKGSQIGLVIAAEDEYDYAWAIGLKD